jgi:RecB family exonuclease
LDRLSKCTGSFRLSELYACKNEASDDSDEGDLLHKAVETELVDGLDEEQKELVARCIAVKRKILSYNQSATLFHEHRVTVSYRGEVITCGTADVVIYDAESKTAYVIDWKFGRNAVPAPGDNLQLLAYGCGLVEELGEENIDHVALVLFQPRIMQDYLMYFASIQLLGLARLRIKAIIEMCQSLGSMAFASGSHCHYCPAKIHCPELMSAGSELPAVKENKVLSSEKMVELYKAWKTIQYRGESLESVFRGMAARGEINGYKIKYVSGGREFTDVNDAASRLSSYISLQDLMPYVKMSVSEVEKKFIGILKEAGSVKNVAEGERAFAALLGDTIRKLPDRKMLKEAAG